MSSLVVPYAEREAIPDSTVPFWAFGMLDCGKGSDFAKVRSHVLQGMRPAMDAFKWGDSWYDTYAKLVDLSFTVASRDPEEWQAQIDSLIDGKQYEHEQLRHFAAKSGPRGTAQWMDWRDDSGESMVFKDFHVRIVESIRKIGLVEVLVPFLHGKSAIASGFVPFMDWAENKEATQIRIYASDDVAKAWSWTLMQIVESSERLHKLWPWIDKPGNGNPNKKFWSSDGFNIAGRELLSQHPSFRAITWATGKVGIRGDRVVADDLVTDENDESVPIQDRIHNYSKSSILSMRTVRPPRGEWRSRYATKWGTVSWVGTVYHKQDANARIQREWQDKPDRKVMRISVFPYKGARNDGVVIWPERYPYHHVMQLWEEMGDRAFRMRLMNQPGGDDGTFGFDEESVKACVADEWLWGQLPAGAPCIIGYDPGSGKTTKWAKNPAWVLLAFHMGYIHVVKWGTWRGTTFPQRNAHLAQLYWEYNCPIAVEDNNQQIAIAEQMAIDYPSVRVICQTTNQNKRDPVQGVESFDPIFRARKVVIHAGDAPKLLLHQLVSEFVDFPDGDTTDLVMAAWFGKRQYELLHKYHDVNVQNNPVPDYVASRGLGGSIDLRPYKDAAARGVSMPWQ